MNDNDLFSLVLDKDETIIKTFRPNKSRAWFGTIITIILLAIIFIPMTIVAFISVPEEGALESGIFCLAFLIIYAAVVCILIALWCNKTVYAVTNKRVLIRTGYIGVDYKSLDYSMVGALTVNVSWVDKLLRKNTGSLAFGSMASPMTNGTVAKFNFSYIDNPYEVYKEIKELIDDSKAKKEAIENK